MEADASKPLLDQERDLDAKSLLASTKTHSLHESPNPMKGKRVLDHLVSTSVTSYQLLIDGNSVDKFHLADVGAKRKGLKCTKCTPD